MKKILTLVSVCLLLLVVLTLTAFNSTKYPSIYATVDKVTNPINNEVVNIGDTTVLLPTVPSGWYVVCLKLDDHGQPLEYEGYLVQNGQVYRDGKFYESKPTEAQQILKTVSDAR